MRSDGRKKADFLRPGRRPAGWHWFILVVGAACMAWIFIGPAYYEWVLGDEMVDIHVFCDTADLRTEDLRALVLYDKVAMSPLARALGLYQNRAPEEVKVFFFVPAEDIELTPVSARLKSVPYGPVSRVMFMAGGRKFHADVRDRRLFDNTIYARAED